LALKEGVHVLVAAQEVAWGEREQECCWLPGEVLLFAMEEGGGEQERY
jgi:hypothetical protein